jgi:hypothetical protein
MPVTSTIVSLTRLVSPCVNPLWLDTVGAVRITAKKAVNNATAPKLLRPGRKAIKTRHSSNPTMLNRTNLATGSWPGFFVQRTRVTEFLGD